MPWWKRSGSRRLTRSRRLLLWSLGVLLGAAILWFTPTPYYVTAPGVAIDTSQVVAVEGGTPHPGRLYMLVVTTRPANLFWYLYSRIDPRAELERPQQFLGDIPDYEHYLMITRRMMEDSQKTAKALALQWTGYGTGVQPVGAEVVSVIPGSPAAGVLQPGDRIIAVDGHLVTGAADLQERMGQVSPGSQVVLRLRRGDVELTLPVSTMPATDAGGRRRAALGVYITDALAFDLPLNVEIRSGSITGPSAGLMFALEIIDQLSPTDLTGGRRVAGTGAIEPDGRVGAVGGVRQKVYTAEAAGAEVIFVPRENYQEALSAAVRIQVVPVSTLKEAVQYLAGSAAPQGA
ncbi:MAG TPA: PDZ domain-containing protein [Symbiobacteriaceae bacterium]